MPQLPPAGVPVTSAITRVALPETSTASSFPLAKNASVRPSGDQNGFDAPVVPGSGYASAEASALTQSVFRPDPHPAPRRPDAVRTVRRRRRTRATCRLGPVGPDEPTPGKDRASGTAAVRGWRRPARPPQRQAEAIGVSARSSSAGWSATIRVDELLDRPDEPVAVTRNGLDERRPDRIVAERPPQHRHGVDQAVVGDRHVAPDRRHDLVLLDEPVAMRDQEHECVEGPRGERDGLVMSPQGPGAEVDGERAEPETDVRGSFPAFSALSSGLSAESTRRTIAGQLCPDGHRGADDGVESIDTRGSGGSSRWCRRWALRRPASRPLGSAAGAGEPNRHRCRRHRRHGHERARSRGGRLGHCRDHRYAHQVPEDRRHRRPGALSASRPAGQSRLHDLDPRLRPGGLAEGPVDARPPAGAHGDRRAGRAKRGAHLSGQLLVLADQHPARVGIPRHGTDWQRHRPADAHAASLDQSDQGQLQRLPSDGKPGHARDPQGARHVRQERRRVGSPRADRSGRRGHEPGGQRARARARAADVRGLDRSDRRRRSAAGAAAAARARAQSRPDDVGLGRPGDVCPRRVDDRQAQPDGQRVRTDLRRRLGERRLPDRRPAGAHGDRAPDSGARSEGAARQGAVDAGAVAVLGREAVLVRPGDHQSRGDGQQGPGVDVVAVPSLREPAGVLRHASLRGARATAAKLPADSVLRSEDAAVQAGGHLLRRPPRPVRERCRRNALRQRSFQRCDRLGPHARPRRDRRRRRGAGLVQTLHRRQSGWQRRSESGSRDSDRRDLQRHPSSLRRQRVGRGDRPDARPDRPARSQDLRGRSLRAAVRSGVRRRGYSPRGIDVDSNGVIWTALAGSGHLASFDRRKCKVLSGPAAVDGQHCREGWTLHPVPGPALQERARRHRRRLPVLQLRRPLQHARPRRRRAVRQRHRRPIRCSCCGPDGSWLVLRVPYPLGFFSRGMDGRIDDPKGGWKGRAIYADYGPNAVWHVEGGLGTQSAVVKFQLRPNPLAK